MCRLFRFDAHWKGEELGVSFLHHNPVVHNHYASLFGPQNFPFHEVNFEHYLHWKPLGKVTLLLESKLTHPPVMIPVPVYVIIFFISYVLLRESLPPDLTAWFYILAKDGSYSPHKIPFCAVMEKIPMAFFFLFYIHNDRTRGLNFKAQ